jgi:hypothetical protein
VPDQIADAADLRPRNIRAQPLRLVAQASPSFTDALQRQLDRILRLVIRVEFVLTEATDNRSIFAMFSRMYSSAGVGSLKRTHELLLDTSAQARRLDGLDRHIDLGAQQFTQSVFQPREIEQ